MDFWGNLDIRMTKNEAMAMKNFQPENVLIGTASIGLTRRNIGSNDIWQGYVNVVGHGELPAYVKRVRSNNELYVEIFSAIFGRALGISIPRPILVYVPSDHPDIPVTCGNNYFFGSEDVDMPSFERLISDRSVLEEVLLEYPDMHKVLTFDELIANPDRNNSNILYNGEDFRFIDHEKCLDHRQSPILPINEFNKITNISDIVKYNHGKNDVKNEILMRYVRKFIKESILKSDVKMLSSCCMTSKMDSNEQEKRIQSFLLSRMNFLEDLVYDSIKDSDQLDLLKTEGM